MTSNQFALLIEARLGFNLREDEDTISLVNDGLLEAAHRRNGYGAPQETLYQISHSGICLCELIVLGEA